MKPAIFAAGLVMRILTWHLKFLIPWSVRDMIVFSQIQNQNLEECVFLLERNISSSCKIGPLYKIYSTSSYAKNLISAINPTGFFLYSIGVIEQYALTELLLLLNGGTTRSILTADQFLYWLNPVIILSSCISWVASLYHLLFVLCFFCASRGFSLLWCCAIAIFGQSYNIILFLVPMLALLLASMNPNSLGGSPDAVISITLKFMAILSVLIPIYYLLHINSRKDKSIRDLHYDLSDAHEYNPATGTLDRNIIAYDNSMPIANIGIFHAYYSLWKSKAYTYCFLEICRSILVSQGSDVARLRHLLQHRHFLATLYYLIAANVAVPLSAGVCGKYCVPCYTAHFPIIIIFSLDHLIPAYSSPPLIPLPAP